MTYREVFNTYNKAIELYGEKAQKLMAIEEMSELTKEICKDFRGKLDCEHLIEEIIDVIITIDQLMMMYGIRGDEIEQMRERKIERLKKETSFLNSSKENGISDFCVRVNHVYFEIDGVLVQKILNIILEDFNYELNGYVEELKQLGVEYVDETA
nr:MAG TPA: nucleoside triphosphate pyrophosphohydrolase [Caudoviricetes sp.]